MGEVHTHLERNGVYMREGHCLHGSGSAEKKIQRSKAMNVEGENMMVFGSNPVKKYTASSCFDSHSKTWSKGLHVPQSMSQQRTL